jgi:hypothetical protein
MNEHENITCPWCFAPAFLRSKAGSPNTYAAARWECNSRSCNGNGPWKIANTLEVAKTEAIKTLQAIANITSSDSETVDIITPCRSCDATVRLRLPIYFVESKALEWEKALNKRLKDSNEELLLILRETESWKKTYAATSDTYRASLNELTKALNEFHTALFEVYPDEHGKFDYMNQIPGRFDNYTDMVLHWYRNCKEK